MNIRLNVGSFHLFVALSRQVTVKGINSKIENSDEHVLFWDFDNVSLRDVYASLKEVQEKFHLGNIVVIDTGLDGYWHAYSFCRYSWPSVLHILASTKHLDSTFFKIGVIRGYFTLRITAKKYRGFTYVTKLYGHQKDNVLPEQLESVIEYRTKRK